MNTYEQRQAARRERLEARADKARNESDQTYQQARDMAGAIPFGQPILVGHHSENRDRNYRSKIHDKFGKSFKLQEKAEYLERRAASVGTGGISSDDPEAIQKLQKQLKGIRKSQELMKKANAVIRKYKGNEDAQVEGILALGVFTNQQAKDLIAPDFAGRVGFASYSLTNNNANARRIEKRIEQLQATQKRDTVEVSGNGYEYREDTDENRVMFIFEGKPDADVRGVLKRHAFKWSPSRGAWVRQLTNAGIYAGQQVRNQLNNL